jgi:hypothetical protein
MLHAQGHLVTVAANNEQQQLLRRNFPGIPLVDLAGYEITYGRSRWSFALAMLLQLPRLMHTIRAEHRWLVAFVAAKKIDGIISDNRYGLWHPSIPSIILTHQPGLKTGLGSLADRLLRPLHYALLERFGETWIVDSKGALNLGGALSHPSVLPANAHYAGLLSQMQPASLTKNDRHLMILLSGPEPQRTLLGDLLWKQVKTWNGKLVFVAGKHDAPAPADIPAHIQFYAQLPVQELQPLMEAASYIVCRGGYSTLMDLAVLRKKALLIPTPGQAEQEYLGRHLDTQGVFPSFPQEHFSLSNALQRAASFPFYPLKAVGANEEIPDLLNRWLDVL